MIIISSKILKLFIITLILIPLFGSCDYLDYNELDQYEKEDIFIEYSRVKAVLTSAYTYLPDDFLSIDGAMRSSASDDAVHEWDLSDIHKFNDGSWNSIVTLMITGSIFYSRNKSCKRVSKGRHRTDI